MLVHHDQALFNQQNLRRSKESSFMYLSQVQQKSKVPVEVMTPMDHITKKLGFKDSVVEAKPYL